MQEVVADLMQDCPTLTEDAFASVNFDPIAILSEWVLDQAPSNSARKFDSLNRKTKGFSERLY